MNNEIELASQRERLNDLKLRLALSTIAAGLRALEEIFSVEIAELDNLKTERN